MNNTKTEPKKFPLHVDIFYREGKDHHYVRTEGALPSEVSRRYPDAFLMVVWWNDDTGVGYYKVDDKWYLHHYRPLEGPDMIQWAQDMLHKDPPARFVLELKEWIRDGRRPEVRLRAFLTGAPFSINTWTNPKVQEGEDPMLIRQLAEFYSTFVY